VSDEAFQFPSDLTIYHAQDVGHKLRDAWLAGTRTFDVSAMKVIDASGAQLLASLQKTAEHQHEAITWTGWTTEATDVLSVLGMNRILGL
jgi:anti-anti-sigma regulatory factor